MTEHYYISSTKYTLQERETKKHGKVYDVVFRIVIPDSHKEKQKKLSGFKTKADAKAAYTAFVTEKCELHKGAAIRRSENNANATVGELYELYIAALQNQVKTSTIYSKVGIFNKYILPKYADEKISHLTKEELYRFQDELWTTKKTDGQFYSYKHLCNIRAHFSAFLDWCASRYGYQNPFPEIKRPKRRAPKTEMQIWTREEFDKFIVCVKEPKYRALFAFLFFTGKRIGEALALSPSDVDLKQKTCKINKSITRKTFGNGTQITSTKADKKQTIPLCAPAVEFLSTYQSPSETYLFPGKDLTIPASENAIRHAFETAINQSGVKPIRIHDLRHSFVSMLIHLGANYNVIADLIGDTVEQVTKTYGHLYQSDKMTVINSIK